MTHPQPAAYMRRWFYDGNEGSKGNRPAGWKLHAITRTRVLADDVPLYFAPEDEKP